ncbi:MAG: hypothetical protein ACW99Q_27225, partial [Candidatus Kariarchaeaceae archaeon]
SATVEKPFHIEDKTIEDSMYLIKKNILINLLRLYKKAECRLLRAENDLGPTIITRVIEFEEGLRIEDFQIDQNGVKLSISDGKTYTIDPTRFAVESEGIIDPIYTIILCGETGYSMFRRPSNGVGQNN